LGENSQKLGAAYRATTTRFIFRKNFKSVLFATIFGEDIFTLALEVISSSIKCPVMRITPTVSLYLEIKLSSYYQMGLRATQQQFQYREKRHSFSA
jgi:hypothetical protein